MAAGWSVLGNCYTTSHQVVNAFTGYIASNNAGGTVFVYTQPVSISFNNQTGVINYTIRYDEGSVTASKTYIAQPCDTDYTPTPANAVITGDGTGIVQPPLETVTPTTKISSLGGDDIILLCAVLFATLFGFSSGISAGKGIVR
ncbi:hypothetical protein [Methylobacillus sp. Pita1]|uniref:hypothetical protein n=1 Tax=Methylobacillus sp. Pita1 TaxID=3382642 RepID=UPI0038B66765